MLKILKVLALYILILQADIACYEMGFYGGASKSRTSEYIPADYSNFSFDYLNCTGSESQLRDCFHAENTSCTYYDGVWINCITHSSQGETTFLLLAANLYYCINSELIH